MNINLLSVAENLVMDAVMNMKIVPQMNALVSLVGIIINGDGG